MRLLQKSEIDKAKALDYSRERAEGLKLTMRVDGLRELAAKEEQSLEKFKKETLKNINQEISDLTSEKEKLENILKPIREEKEKGLKELENKKKELDYFERNLEEFKTSIQLEEIEICKEKEEISEIKKEIGNALMRKLKDETEAAELQREAFDKREEAQNRLNRAKKLEEQALKTKQDIERKLETREATIVLIEEQNKSDKEENIKKEKGLNILKIQLDDQRATLKRAMDRIKNKRHA